MFQKLLADSAALALVVLFGLSCVGAVAGWFFGRWYWSGIRLTYYEAIAQEQRRISAADFRERYAALKRRTLGNLVIMTGMIGVVGLAFALILASGVQHSIVTQRPLLVFMIWMLSLLVLTVPLFVVWFVSERAALLRLRDPNPPTPVGDT